jgi:hypothetical protein
MLPALFGTPVRRAMLPVMGNPLRHLVIKNLRRRDVKYGTIMAKQRLGMSAFTAARAASDNNHVEDS